MSDKHWLMIELSETDFVPLDEFSLHWRFAEALHGHPAPELVARIRPLTPSRAAAIASIARLRCTKGTQAHLTFRSDEAPAEIRERLRGLPPELGALVLVSWDARTAVATDWEAFVTYWDDFCYPASDDVTVWQPDGTWLLCYWHYEVFQFSSGPHAV